MPLDLSTSALRRVGTRLKWHRKRMHIGRTDIANALDCSPAALHRYEAGGITKISTLITISKIVGLSIEQLAAPYFPAEVDAAMREVGVEFRDVGVEA